MPDELFESKKYYAARFVWPIRHEKTPSKRCTWAEWFEDKFGENLEAYGRRMSGEKVSDRLRAD